MPLLVVVVQILQVEMPRLLTVFLREPHALELVGLVLRLLFEAARPRRQLVLLLAALAPRVERHLAHLKIGIHCTFSRTVSNFWPIFLSFSPIKFEYSNSFSPGSGR